MDTGAFSVARTVSSTLLVSDASAVPSVAESAVPDGIVSSRYSGTGGGGGAASLTAAGGASAGAAAEAAGELPALRGAGFVFDAAPAAPAVGVALGAAAGAAAGARAVG